MTTNEKIEEAIKAALQVKEENKKARSFYEAIGINKKRHAELMSHFLKVFENNKFERSAQMLEKLAEKCETANEIAYTSYKFGIVIAQSNN
jgi:hypothetical protein